jgi:hypothetical protein
VSRLTASEREVVCTIADDEAAWHAFTDSTRLTRKLLTVAAQWGVTPERCGVGYKLTLPLAAVRFVGPRRTTDRQRAASRQALQAARFALQNPLRTEAVEGATAPARVRTPAGGSDP